MSSSIKRFVIVAVVFFAIGFLLKVTGKYIEPDEDVIVSKNSILQMDLRGVIFDAKKFIKTFNKYKDDPRVKAIVIDINSPGGAVGPSQEIYNALKAVSSEVGTGKEVADGSPKDSTKESSDEDQNTEPTSGVKSETPSENSDPKKSAPKGGSKAKSVGESKLVADSSLKSKHSVKKPIVCVSTGLLASGAYYSAVGCNKIIVAPGAMVGSIGVIMEFANLEKLYDWAKVSRFAITSGKFKDSGSEFRAMRDDERQLFQTMINEVYAQFRGTVQESRGLTSEIMDKYADGRVFTGTKAVQLGFADKVGFLDDGIQLAAELAGLGKNYEIYHPPKHHLSLWDLFQQPSEDEEELYEGSVLEGTFLEGIISGRKAGRLVDSILRAKFLNQPLYLLPGYW